MCGVRKETGTVSSGRVTSLCMNTAWRHSIDSAKHKIKKSSKRHNPYFDMLSMMLQSVYGTPAYLNR